MRANSQGKVRVAAFREKEMWIIQQETPFASIPGFECHLNFVAEGQSLLACDLLHLCAMLRTPPVDAIQLILLILIWPLPCWKSSAFLGRKKIKAELAVLFHRAVSGGVKSWG